MIETYYYLLIEGRHSIELLNNNQELPVILEDFDDLKCSISYVRVEISDENKYLIKLKYISKKFCVKKKRKAKFLLISADFKDISSNS